MSYVTAWFLFYYVILVLGYVVLGLFGRLWSWICLIVLGWLVFGGMGWISGSLFISRGLCCRCLLLLSSGINYLQPCHQYQCFTLTSPGNQDELFLFLSKSDYGYNSWDTSFWWPCLGRSHAEQLILMTSLIYNTSVKVQDSSWLHIMKIDWQFLSWPFPSIIMIMMVYNYIIHQLFT